MDNFGKGMAALLTVALSLASVACAAPTDAQQEKAMQEAMELKIRQEQDRAAAISDEAAALDSRPLKPFLGYADLPSGPALTADQILGMVQALAGGLRTADDFEPASVEKLLGLKLPPDADNDRRGVAGRMGEGRYSWAVWKLYAGRPGQFVELELSDGACLPHKTVWDGLVADGFGVFVPPFGDDPRVMFDKKVAPSLGLYIAATPDDRDAPTCFTAVSFELDRIDG